MKAMLLASAAALSLGSATSAAAQDAVSPADADTTANSGTDIVVTARRTEERLQDVPISITALTADQLEATGARSLEDVARQTPGFSFDRTTGTLSQPVIRGQAQTRLTNPVQNVATFFNGVYLQRSYQVDSDLLGLERVEIIKGPQSALFGRNAFAGAINYVTKRPDLSRFSVGVEGTVGSQSRREIKGSVSVPIGGIFAFSAAGSFSEVDGSWRNNDAPFSALSGGAFRTNGRLNGHDNSGFLLQARLKPVDLIEVNAFWSRRSIFIESPANYQMASIGLISAFNTMNCSPYQPSAQALRGTNSQFCGALPSTPIIAAGEPRTPGLVADRRTYGQDSETNIAGATVDVSPSDTVTLSYSFGYTDASATSLGTLSRDPQRGVGLPGPFTGRVLFDSRGNGDIRSYSHELRANYETSSMRLMLGGFAATVSNFDYGASYAGFPNSTADLTNTLFPNGNLFPPGFSSTQRNERIRSIFGLASVEPVEGLRVTVEGRETWENIRQQAALFPSRARIGTLFQREFRYFTPRLTIDYKPAQDVMIYASASRGAKSGGFNPSATLAPEQVYQPETNWTYELGMKAALADGRVQLNAAVYHTDWNSLQVNRAQTGGTIGTPLILGNVSGAKVDGVEVSGIVRLGAGFTLNTGLGYNRARFNGDASDPTIPLALCQNPATLPAGSPPCPYTAAIGGKTIPRAPELQANVGMAYRGDIGKAFGQPLVLTGRLDAAYQSKLYVDNTNTAWAPDRTIVDASMGVEIGDVSIRAFVRNAFDSKYVSYAFATFAGSGAGSGITYTPLLGERRTWGFTVRARY